MSKTLCLGVLFVLFALSQASHYRYGTISFVKSAADPQSVTYTLNIVARRSYYPNVVNGGLSFSDGTFYPGDNTASGVTFTVTSQSANEDLVFGTYSRTVRYAGAGTYSPYYYGCCRISTLMNNRDTSLTYTATLIITADEIAKNVAVNNSPVTNSLPIINVPFGVVPFSYDLLASDPERGIISFVSATPAQQGQASAIQPPGLVTAIDGVITLNQGLGKGLWSTQQILTDNFGQKISVDYLLLVADPIKYCTSYNASNQLCFSGGGASKVCSTESDCTSASCDSCLSAAPRIITSDISTTDYPRTNLPAPADGSTVSVQVGSTVVITFVVDDSNINKTSRIPTVYTTNIPSYATTSPQKACTPANGCTYIGGFTAPQFIQVTLRPTASANGTQQVVCVGANSLGNPLLRQHCVLLSINNPVCGNGVLENGEDCDGSACCTNNCTFADSSVVCRASGGDCDVAESCSGVSASCPADSFVASNTICRASGGDCDAAETCTGSSASCPTDIVSSSSTVCRASVGDCDVEELCTGSTSACPADSFQPSSTVCRASAGDCDVMETCTGSTASCPSDSFQSSSTVCRASAGACDVAETCSGSSASCPSDTLRNSSVVCRAAINSCDFAEKCTGSNSACPADLVNQKPTCFCARQSATPKAFAEYFCTNTTSFYQCLYGAYLTQSKVLSCARGSDCGCHNAPFGTECGCSGARGPCAAAGDTLPACP